MQKKDSNEKAKNKKQKRILMIVLFILLLVAIGITFSFCHAGTPNGSPSPSSQSAPSSLDDNGNALPGGYVPKSRQEILSELREKEVVVTDKVSEQIAFSSGGKGTVGTWAVENPASNKVIEQCAVILNGQTVATSVPIYPGQHIEQITLSQKVAPGTYDVIANIKYYSTDTKSLLGQADYRLKLTVS